ncbi:hypothetical protein [Xylanibacter caecicola]|uniref:hypothetical protein n=1 Tax=Xylanibacter caecicola TaxID=2736294 RepID=UPI0025860782|nr:hypothetical protein [Xylanibacter caecicola]
MKKFLTVITALFTLTVSAGAMSYDRAREQALFLTDKMAYELNLSDDQYEAAYEVNLDYLMSINSYDDLYGAYWRNRNLDLSYILLDWQYRAFCAASYFYRPLYWHAGAWHFGIYARYPHRNYFYFGRPHFYVSYRGGHSWRHNGGRSWYHGRTYGRPHREGGHGMRDRFDRGDYHKKDHGNMHKGNGGHTGNRDGRFGNGSGRFGGNNRGTTTGRPSVNNSDDKKPGNGNRPSGDNRGHNRFGSGNTHNPGSNAGRSFGNRVTERESSTRSTVTRGGSTHGRFGADRSAPTRNVSSPTRSITRPAGTFTPRGNSSPAGKSAGTSHSSGGNRSGGHFGGRR